MIETLSRSSEARQRIVDTVQRLFYADGVRADGIEAATISAAMQYSSQSPNVAKEAVFGTDSEEIKQTQVRPLFFYHLTDRPVCLLRESLSPEN